MQRRVEYLWTSCGCLFEKGDWWRVFCEHGRVWERAKGKRSGLLEVDIISPHEQPVAKEVGSQ